VIRVHISEVGQPSAGAPNQLPPIDIADAAFVIGSAPTARVRLPAASARAEHVRIAGATWRTADGSGAIGDGVELAIGSYRVRIAPSPPGAVAAPPQRTESLARELMRNLLGTGGAPTLEVERGVVAGAKRMLAPPESALVIGRGDDAGWVIDDRDLSKRHAEVRRGWDGTRLVDLDSKNGTRLDGAAIREAELRDGALVELGNLALRYRDPAERHLRASAQPAAPELPAPAPRGNPLVFYAALAVAAAALAAIAWLAH
jgi:hypothetical protein